MAEAYRISLRKSIFAVLVAYLRDSTVDVSAFPTYPTTQGVWTFLHNGSLYQITYTENGQNPPISPGVTVEFGGDVAGPSQDLPQQYTIDVRFRIRVPWDFAGERTAHEIAQRIDNCWQACYGKVQIVDFSQNPPSGYSEYVENQSTERGNWQEDKPTTVLSDLFLELKFAYEEPASVLGGNAPATVPIDEHAVPFLPLDKGGTAADLSATGPGVVVQPDTGAPLEILDYVGDTTLFLCSDGTWRAAGSGNITGIDGGDFPSGE
jgi:hypothetical protein